jgi:hypothetical protein
VYVEVRGAGVITGQVLIAFSTAGAAREALSALQS